MKYVVTSAQQGARVNKRFLNSLLHYCKRNKAELMVIPLKGIGNTIYEYDNSITDYLIDDTKENIKLNDGIQVSSLKISPTQINPLTGLKRFADASIIFGSPKLALEYVPTSNWNLPKAIMTSGTVTDPFYSQKTKAGRVAGHDHRYAAIMVEMSGDQEFHFRQLESNANGEFNDLGWKYTANQRLRNEPLAIVLGDTHVGSVCPKVDKATDEMINDLKPGTIVLHDLLDSYSINHHHENDIITKTLKAETYRGDLKAELEAVGDFLIEKGKFKHKPQLVVVDASNHNEALDRYIKEGRFMNDLRNLRVSAEILLNMLNGKKALESFVCEMGKKENRAKLSEVKFLGADDDYSIAGVQCANHGHLGLNGARGNIKSQEIGAKKSVIGHSHTPGIWHQVYQVGTSTHLKLEYNRGFSSWMNTHCIIYKDGSRQLINIINGNWKLDN